MVADDLPGSNRGTKMRPEIRMARHIEGLECYRAGRSSCEAAESLGISERNPGVFATAMRRKERRD